VSDDPILELPVFPLKNTALFPFLGMPLAASRPISIAAIESAVATEEKEILVFAQKDAAEQEPTKDGLFDVGTKAVIRRLAPVPSGGVQLFVQGTTRIRLGELTQEKPFLRAKYQPAPIALDVGADVEALEREVKALGAKVLALAQPQAEIDIAQLIGGKWKLIILQILIFQGTKRFNELRKMIEGVTQTMLTNQLRALERDGLVLRKVYAEVPPRVEYSPTRRALDLEEMFHAMHAWWVKGENDAITPNSR